jgi:non-heme chloroperoxidase
MVRYVLALSLASTAFAAEAKSGFIRTSDGVRLHYLEAGSGPAIVFQPGWTMTAEIWEPQIRHFSKTHRVVALDPRSQGRSDKPAEGHYEERRAQDIFEAVEQLKLAPAVLVGWSMGVPEILTYIDRFGAGTVRAVVLVDGTVGADPNPARTRQIWNFFLRMQADRPKFAEAFARSMFRKPQPEEYLQRIAAASLQTPTNSAVALLANVMMTGDWRHILAKIDRPLLYVATPNSKADAEKVKSSVPAARVEIFEDCGHALFVDDPARFNKVLESFLKDHGY